MFCRLQIFFFFEENTVNSLHHSYIILLSTQQCPYLNAREIWLIWRLLTSDSELDENHAVFICLVVIRWHDQKEQCTWPQLKLYPNNTDPVLETSTWIVRVREILELTSDIFRELKSRLIHSMSLLIVMSVFLLARGLACGHSVVWQK